MVRDVLIYLGKGDIYRTGADRGVLGKSDNYRTGADRGVLRPEKTGLREGLLRWPLPCLQCFSSQQWLVGAKISRPHTKAWPPSPYECQ